MSVTMETLSEMITQMKIDINNNNNNLRKDIDSKFITITNEIKSDVVLLKEKNNSLEVKVENLERLSH